MPTPLSEIGHVIQLAIAPVFLLTAIGAILNVLTGRLGRAVDRRRVLTAEMPGLGPDIAALAQQELEFEHRRIRLVYVAIGLAVLSALVVCLMIPIAFIDAFVALDLGKLVATLFVLALLALTGSLAVFMREIFLAVASVRAQIR
ncbi:MAG TPA: DUF2721 domain-containing protein [Burkholderiales bacterium]|nr:DUF2721 domain-containing protein [Burkholderiales bacterium]